MVKRLFVFVALLVQVLLAAVVFVPRSAFAATAEACNTSIGGFLGLPTWYKYLNPQFVDGECNISFQFPNDIGKVLLAVFEILLRIGGLVAVVFIIYGGFQYLLSQGEPDRVKGARSTIINALIGLAIAISATAIVNLVARNIT